MGCVKGERTLKNFYWKVFYLAFSPVRLIAGVLWINEWIPLGRSAPYVLGASICRWPNKVK